MALAMASSFLFASSPWKPRSSSSSLGSARSDHATGSLAISIQRPAAVATPARVFVVQPFASRVCQLTGKKYNNAMKISYSHHRTKKKQHPNLQYKRLWWEAGKRFVRLRICTQAIKTIDKKGLDVMAKEAGINLHEY